MSLLFELEQHQKLVVYEEGNQILAVRLPLRRGGEFRMRDGCLSDLTGVIYRGNIRLAWQSLEHHIILSGTEEQSDPNRAERWISCKAVRRTETGGKGSGTLAFVLCKRAGKGCMACLCTADGRGDGRTTGITRNV